MPRALRVKFILPALTEAKSPFWRPIKYSLFPPLGLATLAAYLRAGLLHPSRRCRSGRDRPAARTPPHFLDDHLLGDRRFAEGLFEGMRGMGRLFHGAAAVESVLRGDLIEKAAEAGLRSLFVGFETFSPTNLLASNKKQNLARDYAAVARCLSDLGVMINGSFVFGMDDDGPDVFARTVDWAVENGVTTATFHIMTPYPGTALYKQMAAEGRLTTSDWDRYDTRQVVYRPAGMSAETLKAGYD